MNRKDLLEAREHAQRMIDRYAKDLEGERCSCGCKMAPLQGWKLDVAESGFRQYSATVEAIDLALKTLEATDAA